MPDVHRLLAAVFSAEAFSPSCRVGGVCKQAGGTAAASVQQVRVANDPPGVAAVRELNNTLVQMNVHGESAPSELTFRDLYHEPLAWRMLQKSGACVRLRW